MSKVHPPTPAFVPTSLARSPLRPRRNDYVEYSRPVCRKRSVLPSSWIGLFMWQELPARYIILQLLVQLCS